MNRLAWIPTFLFVFAVPLFLVTASVAWAFNDPGVYNRGFQKYRISLTSGITEEDLRQVGGEIRHYFNSTDEPLLVNTQVYGEERELFNQREVQHMRDVKRLVWWVYAAAIVSGIYLLAATAWGVAVYRRGFLDVLAQRVIRGVALMVVLVVVVGAFAMTGFDALFLRFHRVAFTNDLWQLDPRTDYLLIIFPQGFWFDATMRVAALTVAGAVALTLGAGGHLLWRRKTGRGTVQ
ncbi:MAG: TIGR01906 family membrane protein [Gemmatimonadetes bacterium]|nr:TIGR01906 family membrane protein [Gemmatimonadota bacterium]